MCLHHRSVRTASFGPTALIWSTDTPLAVSLQFALPVVVQQLLVGGLSAVRTYSAEFLGVERGPLLLSGLMAGRVDPGTKYIVSGRIVQPVLAVLILTSHKFTTSAFWMLRLTGERFRARMRSVLL
ncbi:unnamed protein product [Leuciscus chuanchicus]